jgi:hypothetical protein
MARLTLSYIRLAVDHRACTQALAMTDAAALDATIGWLEIAALTQPSHGRPRLRQWLEIARRRAERRREAHATMESLSHQLATLAELSQLVHQDALCVSSSELPAEVDTIFDELAYGERAARELASVGIVDAQA